MMTVDRRRDALPAEQGDRDIGDLHWFPPSADEHGLADDLPVDQCLHRRGRLAQREAAPDAGFELALPSEVEQRLAVRGGDFGVGFVESADPHADCLYAFDQQVVGAGAGPLTTKKSQNQDAPTPGQAAQRFLERRTVYRIVDDVDATASCQLHDFVAKPFPIIDRVVCALGETDRSLLVGARSCDDMRSVEFGDLDRRDPDAARSAMDQYPIAGFEAA